MSILIEIEGIHGAGKTTVIPYIEKHFTDKGMSVLSLKEPGTTVLGEEIRRIVATSETADYNLSSLTQMFLFLANRSDVNDKYNLESDDYDMLLFDRYYGSTYVYQTLDLFDRNKTLDRFNLLNASMNNISKRFPPVTVTVLLDLYPEIALERVKNRQITDNRPEFENLDGKKFVLKNKIIRKKFLNYYYNCLKNDQANNNIIVDSSNSIKEVANSAISGIELAIENIRDIRGE